MRSFHGKNNSKLKIFDRVFISSTAKNKAILEKIRNQSVIIITWFEDSCLQTKALVESNNLTAEIFMAREMTAHNIQNNAVLFFEHYPLAGKEIELLEKLQLKEATFYSSLDESFFKHFGGAKMVLLIEKMGFSENEAIEHPMISTAIRNAQEKISKEIIVEHSASSQAEWFSKNIVK
jgi:hypothetical protein